MDSIDGRIVALLEVDARLTYADIGTTVGLAPSSVHDRVRKLEKKGVIKGYRGEIDRALAGLPVTAFVSLTLGPTTPSDVPALVAKFPHVESCYSVAGDHSYVLVVRAPSTSALEELLDRLRARLQATTRSTVVLSTAFENRPMLQAGVDVSDDNSDDGSVRVITLPPVRLDRV